MPRGWYGPACGKIWWAATRRVARQARERSSSYPAATKASCLPERFGAYLSGVGASTAVGLINFYFLVNYVAIWRGHGSLHLSLLTRV